MYNNIYKVLLIDLKYSIKVKVLRFATMRV